MDILSPFALEALGLIGVVFYLGSYATLQLGLIDGQSNTYAVLNIIAASNQPDRNLSRIHFD
jgi:hypothetical protein